MKLNIWLIAGILALVFLNSASALTVGVHVPEKYAEVNAGDRFYFELTIKYPENPTRVDLRMTYQVVSEAGDVVAQTKGLKAVETQASFSDFIILPEEMEEGKYSINVNIKDYGELSQDVESTFYVAKNRVDMLFTYIYVLSGAIFFLMCMIIYLLIRRGK